MSMFFKENKIFIFKICLFSIENTTKQMLVIFQKRREILIRQQFSAIQELDFRFFWQGGGGGEVFFFFFFEIFGSKGVHLAPKIMFFKFYENSVHETFLI